MRKTVDLKKDAPVRKLSCVALSIANLLAMPTSVFAADIMVSNGGCTLVDAVLAANNDEPVGDCVKGDVGADVIFLPDSSVQTLSVGFENGVMGSTNPFTGLPFVTSNITIQGNDSTLSRDSTDPFRLIAVTGSGYLTINDLTVENGSLSYNGGGIYVGPTAQLVLNDSTVVGNTADYGVADTGNGGGLYSRGGTITVNSSSISGNSAAKNGGAIVGGSNGFALYNSTISNNTIFNNDGSSRGAAIFASNLIYQVKIEGSSISGNSAGNNFRGAIYANNADIRIISTTVSDNKGGGIVAVDNVDLTLSNSTISGNNSNTGAGIFAFDNSEVRLLNSTISRNQSSASGTALDIRVDSTLSLTNSIIADNPGFTEVYINGTSSIGSDTVSIIEGQNLQNNRTGSPELLPLANNGGPTKTHALKPNSIARDTGILGTCLMFDQRGQLRDDGDGKCDVGAIEFNPNDDSNFIVIPLGNGKAAVIPN